MTAQLRRECGGVVRYGRIEDLFRLAQLLQGTREGLSLQDIGLAFGVGRRTSERMRDAVMRAFPQMEEVAGGERFKRWRIPGGTINGLVAFNATELADLATAAQLLRTEGLSAQARSVEGIATKVGMLVRPKDAAKVETDFAALVEAEGLAMRPGPRPQIDGEVFSVLRRGILAMRKVRITYRARGTGTVSKQIICPYGFLYGNRHYLVAYSMGMRDYRLYSLSNVEKAEVTDWPFEKRDFSLAQFAQNSFGVFQGEPIDVVWEFSKRAAFEARNFHFHPTETKTVLSGGRLRVSFCASGALEMAWHLAIWGSEVAVISPRDFKSRVAKEERAYWSNGPKDNLVGE